MWKVVDIDLWLGRSNGCDSVMNFFFFFSPCTQSIEISVLVIDNCHVQVMIDDGQYKLWGITSTAECAS